MTGVTQPYAQQHYSLPLLRIRRHSSCLSRATSSPRALTRPVESSKQALSTTSTARPVAVDMQVDSESHPERDVVLPGMPHFDHPPAALALALFFLHSVQCARSWTWLLLPDRCALQVLSKKREAMTVMGAGSRMPRMSRPGRARPNWRSCLSSCKQVRFDCWLVAWSVGWLVGRSVD